MVIDGNGSIESDIPNNIIKLHIGKTVLIPSSLGNYIIKSDNCIKFLRVAI